MPASRHPARTVSAASDWQALIRDADVPSGILDGCPEETHNQLGLAFLVPRDPRRNHLSEIVPPTGS
jgi:hypothetical protein